MQGTVRSQLRRRTGRGQPPSSSSHHRRAPPRISRSPGTDDDSARHPPEIPGRAPTDPAHEDSDCALGVPGTRTPGTPRGQLTRIAPKVCRPDREHCPGWNQARSGPRSQAPAAPDRILRPWAMGSGQRSPKAGRECQALLLGRPRRPHSSLPFRPGTAKRGASLIPEPPGPQGHGTTRAARGAGHGHRQCSPNLEARAPGGDLRASSPLNYAAITTPASPRSPQVGMIIA